MTTYLGKSCSFCLPRVPFVNCRQFMYLVFPFGFEGRIWDLIVSVPDHCLSFYFDPKKATGVDAIPPKIVKAAAPVISRHIANLANEMQAKEAFPTQLKSAQVTPIFEKDDPFTEKNTAPSASCQRSQKYMNTSSANN